MGAHGLGLASPVLCAAIATWAGGAEGWRWAWFLLGIPVVLVAFLRVLHEGAPRGQFEKQDVLGELFEDEQPAPISMEAAFARIKRIRTIRTVLVGFCALGFGLFSQPALESLYLDDTLHVTNVLHRGLILSLSGIAALPILPLVGRYFDKKYRSGPGQGAGAGRCAHPAVGAAHPDPVQREQQHVVLDPEDPTGGTHHLRVRDGRTGAAGGRAVPPPWHGHRDVDPYIFFIGGFMGGLVPGFLTDATGVRGTVIFLGVPSAIIGGALLMNGARYIRNDLSLVGGGAARGEGRARTTIREQAGDPAPAVGEHRLLVRSGAGLVRGQLQIEKGETVALLGTNGAGKSTVLRVVSGLAVPERGVVRLNGQNITYVSPEMW